MLNNTGDKIPTWRKTIILLNTNRDGLRYSISTL